MPAGVGSRCASCLKKRGKWRKTLALGVPHDACRAVAFDSVRDHICALIEARKAIGLSPTDMPELRRGIRAAIAFGSDIRSTAVRERFEAVRVIANRYLPDGVGPIEVWAMNGSLPVQIG
jgi:hypothetical protein